MKRIPLFAPGLGRFDPEGFHPPWMTVTKFWLHDTSAPPKVGMTMTIQLTVPVPNDSRRDKEQETYPSRTEVVFVELDGSLKPGNIYQPREVAYWASLDNEDTPIRYHWPSYEDLRRIQNA